MSIARTRVQAGETTAWHYLKKSVERYVLLEGRGALRWVIWSPQPLVRGAWSVSRPGVGSG
ncbi:MAG: hypothetical protein PHO79_00485 [Desulfoplanes sp.]|nr:hypothetical protein [Desulfoplanes sp.]